MTHIDTSAGLHERYDVSDAGLAKGLTEQLFKRAMSGAGAFLFDGLSPADVKLYLFLERNNSNRGNITLVEPRRCAQVAFSFDLATNSGLPAEMVKKVLASASQSERPCLVPLGAILPPVEIDSAMLVKLQHSDGYFEFAGLVRNPDGGCAYRDVVLFRSGQLCISMYGEAHDNEKIPSCQAFPAYILRICVGMRDAIPPIKVPDRGCGKNCLDRLVGEFRARGLSGLRSAVATMLGRPWLLSEGEMLEESL